MPLELCGRPSAVAVARAGREHGASGRERSGVRGGRREGSGRMGFPAMAREGGRPFLAVVAGLPGAAGSGGHQRGREEGERSGGVTRQILSADTVSGMGLVVFGGWEIIWEVRSDAAWWADVYGQLAERAAEAVQVFWRHEVLACARFTSVAWIPENLHRMPCAHGGHVALQAAQRAGVSLLGPDGAVVGVDGASRGVDTEV